MQKKTKNKFQNPKRKNRHTGDVGIGVIRKGFLENSCIYVYFFMILLQKNHTNKYFPRNIHNITVVNICT